MFTLLTTLHVLIAVVLIFAVLLQSARGTDLAGAFGGMGSQTAFGPRGTATFLSKATVVLAVSFMVTSVSLAILSNRLRGTGGGSVLSGEKPPSAPTAPAQPAAPLPETITQEELIKRFPEAARQLPVTPTTPAAPTPPSPASQAPATATPPAATETAPPPASAPAP